MKLDRLFNKKNMDVLSTAHERNRALDSRSNQEGSDEEFLSKNRPREDAENIDPQVRREKSSGVNIMKNKRLKIDSGRAGSKRLVFDEGGNALPPLAALARDGNEGNISAPGVIAEAAGERFKRVKEEMKKRDKEDRLSEKQRLREIPKSKLGNGMHQSTGVRQAYV